MLDVSCFPDSVVSLFLIFSFGASVPIRQHGLELSWGVSLDVLFTEDSY